MPLLRRLGLIAAACALAGSFLPAQQDAEGRRLRRYRARHILLVWKGHPHAPQSVTRTKEEVREHARELVRALRRGEKDFAELAREESICPSRLDGGYLGQFLENEMHPDFIRALEPATMNTVTGPIETSMGFVIFERLPIEQSWPELLNLKHVLVAYKGAHGAGEDVTRSKEEAAIRVSRVIAELKTEKLDFAAAAAKYSDDRRSAMRGGELGAKAPLRFVTPSFVDRVLALPVGEVHGPIESPFGYHVVVRLEVPVPMRASHILIPFAGAPQSGDTQRTEQQAKAFAEELKQKLESGADFAELAARHSSCPTARSGGDLGEFRSGTWVAAFEEALRSAEVGKIVGPVRTRFGYHLILRTQ